MAWCFADEGTPETEALQERLMTEICGFWRS
jgi:hypothetical protein